MKIRHLPFLVLLVFSNYGCGQNVRLLQDDQNKRVDILIGGKKFTSFNYPAGLEKPFLFPIYAPNGSVVTRGYPIAPRKGERVDHPHQTGLWFNHGNVNGIDFWNNSSAIASTEKDHYGHISVQKILKTEGGEKGILEVISNWEDNKGNVLLEENTTYIFSEGNNGWIIDHIATLTAVADTVKFTDNKEGMFAIRVDRAFEMPSDESLIFTDEKGNLTTVKAADNTGVTGMYRSSNGKTGDEVWGTRNEWVILNGKKDNTSIGFGIFDYPGNKGFPAYSHARGYGLFSINNFGARSYDNKADQFFVRLQKGESIRLIHRFFIEAGTELTPAMAIKIFEDFKNTY
jgi:hypothetical protein